VPLGRSKPIAPQISPVFNKLQRSKSDVGPFKLAKPEPVYIQDAMMLTVKSKLVEPPKQKKSDDSVLPELDKIYDTP
jgi:hypothetical protein